MTDEIDDLRAAMSRATPAADPERKAADLRLALENFDRLQGTADGARPIPRRAGFARVLDGARKMLNALNTRGGLAATTALVAVGMILVLPQGRALLTPTGPVVSELDGGSTPAVVEEEALRQRADGGEDEQREMSVAAESKAASGSVSETQAPMPAPPPQAARRLELENGAGRAMLSDAPEALFGQVQDADVMATAPASVAAEAPAFHAAPSDVVVVAPENDTEAFANAETSPLKVVAEEPVSTFSIDVDTASYAVVRSSLMAGVLPPPDAVRVEEMINYFPYDYPAPDGAHPFRPTVTVMPTPWNPGTELVHVGIQGTLPAIADRPALNLVFLIDTSGSMQDANKLPLLKQSFRLMLSELRPEDEVSIVTYAGSAGRVLDPTPAGERSTILAALDRLEAGGSTAGQEGLQQAYATAESMAAEGEVTRVILATDGDFNVGLSDPEALKDFIAGKRRSGTYLSVLGFGRGNLDDATMQALAQNGNGQAAYIDTLSEARKVLVDQLTGALFPIANDVKIQIEFNPATVAEYRLIGYETRALRREDFSNDRIDAGDIGAGHSVTAIYEVTPVGSDAVRTGSLRYAGAQAGSGAVPVSDELGFFKMRYKRPGEAASVLIEEPIRPEQGVADDDIRFSVAIAGFGQLLRGGDYLGAWDYDAAAALASSAKGEDPFGYRAEAVTLMRLAGSLDRR